MPPLHSTFSLGAHASGFAVCRMRRLGAVLAAFTCVQGLALAQQAEDNPGRSPFLPPGWEQRQTQTTQRPAAAEAAAGSYVFNGMIQIGSRTLFSIGNTQTGQAMLLEMGSNSGEVQINSYDAQRNIVSLSGGGRTEELALRKSDGEPLAVVADSRAQGNRGGAGAQGRQGQAAQGGTNVARGGPPVEWLEARRQRLDEQIERRRSELAAQGGDNSGAVAVGVGSGGNGAAASNGNNATMRANQAGANSGQSGQNVRARRLRMEMNP